MAPIIEEISDHAAAAHYVDKAWESLAADPAAFFDLVIDRVSRDLTDDEKRAVAATARARIAERLWAEPPAAPRAAHVAEASAPASSASGGSAAATGRDAAAPVTPAAELGSLSVEEKDAAAAAAAAAEEEEEEEEEEEREEPREAEESGDAEAGSGAPELLSPNAGNGHDFPTYRWTQTLSEVVVTIPVPPRTKGRDCDVEVSPKSLRAGLRGQPPVLTGPFLEPIQSSESLWSLSDGSWTDAPGAAPRPCRLLEITIPKRTGMSWWPSVVVGEPEIDVTKVEPENSKLDDLDAETRQTVEKMMWDQRQKQLGLPTSDEQAKADALARFMKSHPEMDFSDAKIM